MVESEGFEPSEPFQVRLVSNEVLSATQSTLHISFSFITIGGEGGIRTHGGLSPSLVFKTSLVNHLSTSPYSYLRKMVRAVGLEPTIRTL